MKPLNLRSRVTALILCCLTFFFLSSSTCITKDQTLIEAMLATCGEPTVFLSAWFTNVEDQSQILRDPIGGYIFLYWIDEDGNACHGEPGVSGRPGPIIFPGYNQESLTPVIDNLIITEEQLKDFQTISFDLQGYDAKGMHFVQFDNISWRIREDGIGFRDDSMSRFSIPVIVSLDYQFCLVPVFAYGNDDCARADYNIFLQLPGLPDESGQHPTMCRNRIMPVSLELSTEERLNYIPREGEKLHP